MLFIIRQYIYIYIYIYMCLYIYIMNVCGTAKANPPWLSFHRCAAATIPILSNLRVPYAGLILGFHPANDRRRYKVPTSLQSNAVSHWLGAIFESALVCTKTWCYVTWHGMLWRRMIMQYLWRLWSVLQAIPIKWMVKWFGNLRFTNTRPAYWQFVLQ